MIIFYSLLERDLVIFDLGREVFTLVRPGQGQKWPFWAFLGKMTHFGAFCLARGLWFFRPNLTWLVKFCRMSGRFWLDLIKNGHFWSFFGTWIKKGQFWWFWSGSVKSDRQSALFTVLVELGHFWSDHFWTFLAQIWSNLGRLQKWVKNGPFLGSDLSKNYT